MELRLFRVQGVAFLGLIYNQCMDSLTQQRRSLPQEPGVYFFKNSSGEILYIGKAKSIRSRVNSHFSRTDARGKEMIARTAQLDCMVLGNEHEALLAEQNLIQQHQPRYNVLLKNGQAYPWIAISTDQEYPRVYLTREKHKKGRRYFGPYTSARQASQIVDLLNRIFLLRSCTAEKPGRQGGSPCLDYHIGRCSAPCFKGGKSKQAYQKTAGEALACLEGGWKALSEKLQEEMKKASQEQKYEKAARYRDLNQDLDKLFAKQRVTGLGNVSCDLVALAGKEDDFNIQLWRVREGILEAKLGFYLKGETPLEVMEAFISQHYLASTGSSMIPAEILVEESLSSQLQELAQVLSQDRDGPVRIKSPGSGKKGSLWKTVSRNAKLALERENLHQAWQQQQSQQSLHGLMQELHLESLPSRIECYDASHLMGTHTYVSMVVLQDGQPLPAHYRIFRMDDQAGNPDDFLSLQTALERRLERLGEDLSPNDPKWDRSFSQKPDLVIVDGGLGQLHAAREALKGWPAIPLAALAKREEEVFVLGKDEPLNLPKDHPGLLVMQRARDEAHRFALQHHRRSRDSQLTRSVLDNIPGVGRARRKQLMEHFGSLEKLRKASLEEIEQILPEKLALQVFDYLSEQTT